MKTELLQDILADLEALLIQKQEVNGQVYIIPAADFELILTGIRNIIKERSKDDLLIQIFGEPEVSNSLEWLYRSSTVIYRYKLCGATLDESWYNEKHGCFQGCTEYPVNEHLARHVQNKQRITLKEFHELTCTRTS